VPLCNIFVSIFRPKSALQAKIFDFLGKITTAEGGGYYCGVPPLRKWWADLPHFPTIDRRGCIPLTGGDFMIGVTRRGDQKVFIFGFSDPSGYTPAIKNNFFSPAVCFYDIYIC